MKTEINVKPYNQYPIAPMDAELSKNFVRFSIKELQGDLDVDDPEIKQMLQSFPCLVISKRFEAYRLNISPLATIFLACLNRSLGENSLYVHAFGKWLREHNFTELNMARISDVFPFGFPSEESYSAAWDAQKVDGANGVDLLLMADSF